METSLPTFDDFLGRGHLFAGLSSQVFVFLFVFVFVFVIVLRRGHLFAGLAPGIFNFLIFVGLSNPMVNLTNKFSFFPICIGDTSCR